jgi:hypothetical protein
MQRIAVPMIGGMVSSTVLTLVVIPAVYAVVEGFRLPGGAQNAAYLYGRGLKVAGPRNECQTGHGAQH